MRTKARMRASLGALAKGLVALVAVLLVLGAPLRALAYEYDAATSTLTLEGGEVVAVGEVVPALADPEVAARMVTYCDESLFENVAKRYVSYDPDQGTLAAMVATGSHEIWLVDPDWRVERMRIVVAGPAPSTPGQGAGAQSPSPGHWSLASLYAVIASVSASAAFLYKAMGRRGEDERPASLPTVVTFLPTVAAVVVFLCTQDFAGSMVVVDAWLVPIAACALVQAIYLQRIYLLSKGSQD